MNEQAKRNAAITILDAIADMDESARSQMLAVLDATYAPNRRPVATTDDLMRVFLLQCPQGEMGEDQEGQLIFYTGMSQTADGQLQAFEDEEERSFEDEEER